MQNEKEKMSQFLLKEYEVRSAEYARIHQFVHNMGLTLLAVSGVIWVFCLSSKDPSSAVMRFAILLPAVFGFSSLAWIIRYTTELTETRAYLRFVVETWFGAGRGFFEHLAVNQYNLTPPTEHRKQFAPFARSLSFFIGFPFQHIIIGISVVIFVLLFPWSRPFFFLRIAVLGFVIILEILLLRWHQKRIAHYEALEKLWAQFRHVYRGPCPDSFRPIDWDSIHLSGDQGTVQQPHPADRDKPGG